MFVTSRYDPQLPQEVADQDPEEEDRAGDPDEREEKIKGLSAERLIERLDHPEEDHETEPQTEEKAKGLYHETDFSQTTARCQP